MDRKPSKGTIGIHPCTDALLCDAIPITTQLKTRMPLSLRNMSSIVPYSPQQQKRGKDTSAAKMNSISTFIVWFVVAFLYVWTFFGSTLEVENGTKVTIAKTPTSKLSIMMTMMMFVFSSIRSMVVTQWDGLVRPGPTSSHH